MKDRNVREALRRKVFAEHLRDPNTLVVEELGIAYGEVRIDVAVVNGRLHGFEIKSDADTLHRLPAQMALYSAVFDRVTLVVGNKHLTDAVARVPKWWGIKLAVSGIRGAVHFEEVRTPKLNAEIDPASLATLFWRNEALAFLERRGERGFRSKSRAQLYEVIATRVPLNDLKDGIRSALKLRAGWRSDAQRVPYAD